ncbi:MAG: hypothetical protein MJE63_28090 [Proteobacteria bacterium]|nr:hypothetical protein [Pseudomonadota bacterium]
MADFHQDKVITTLHALHDVFDREEYLSIMEKRLEEHAKHWNICLLLPSLYSELQNPEVLDRIIDGIKNVNYIHRVVVALGGTTEYEQFQEAKNYFNQLKTDKRDVKVVWVEGPKIQTMLSEIKEREIQVGVQGKGQSVWIAMGYIFAKEDCKIIGMHDCDIVTYDRILLARLFEAVANPNNDFQFCKGYYMRVSPSEKAMKGRVTRLFVTPFVDSMIDIMEERGHKELANFFNYHRTFKYPLAGEFSFSTQLGRGINVSYDWGLEVATLSQVYDQLIARKIVQIDLVPNYEHKHQIISEEDAKKGLHRMVVDIAKFYLTYMRSHGVPLDDAFVDMMLHTYYQNTLRFIRKYSYDAEVNGLKYDLYMEEATAKHFRGFLWTAWEESKGPHEARLIPSWNRVRYTFPEIYEKILSAVETDNRE